MPRVVISETHYILCKKLMNGGCLPPDHAEEIEELSADGIYIALAEELAALGTAELLTFDAGFLNQAMKRAPTVAVRLLTPDSLP